jgi:carboxymethylenebutenolidase
MKGIQEMAQDVNVQVGDATMGIYVAEPDGDAKGAIVVVQEAFGVNDHIRSLCHRIAEAGYVAAAPHLFHRSGDPELGYEDMMQVVPYISQLQVNNLEADIQGALTLLAGMGYEGKRVGVVGWCMGGSVSFLAACYWELGAAVSFYGGGITQGRFGIPPLLDLAPTLQTPWLGLFGDLDASIPTDEVEALRTTAAEKAKVASAVVRYADADHGFNCDARSSYHEASATDGWARMLAWFDQHIS